MTGGTWTGMIGGNLPQEQVMKLYRSKIDLPADLRRPAYENVLILERFPNTGLRHTGRTRPLQNRTFVFLEKRCLFRPVYLRPVDENIFKFRKRALVPGGSVIGPDDLLPSGRSFRFRFRLPRATPVQKAPPAEATNEKNL